MAKTPPAPLAHDEANSGGVPPWMSNTWKKRISLVLYQGGKWWPSLAVNFLTPPFVCDVIWQDREENRKSLHSYPFYGKRTDLRFWWQLNLEGKYLPFQFVSTPQQWILSFLKDKGINLNIERNPLLTNINQQYLVPWYYQPGALDSKVCVTM